eukprot:16431812-Heterocapsa_arctica.AAC.1
MTAARAVAESAKQAVVDAQNAVLIAEQAALQVQQDQEDAEKAWQEHIDQGNRPPDHHPPRYSCIAGTCHVFLADSGLPRALTHLIKGDRIQ